MPTRKELNDLAWELDIDGVEKMRTKAEVEAAIAAAIEPPNHFADGTPAYVLSIVGPVKARRVLIEVTLDVAQQLFDQPLAQRARPHTVDGVERDIAAIAERDPDLAESGTAAAAIRLAYELENPYNSATSKAQCAKSLRELLERLLELAPPEEGKDQLSEIVAGYDARR